MPRAIYVPVFDRFFESSIMREDVTVRFVMLGLIRLAWRSGADGEVDVDPVMFAKSLNLPDADVEAAIHRLMQPDPASYSPDEDGRRIVPLDPDRPMRGWRLVNWRRYKDLIGRYNDAARKREEYHAAKDNSKTSESLQKSPPPSENLDTIRDDTKRDETKKDRRRFAPPSIDEVIVYAKEREALGKHRVEPQRFLDYHAARGWMLGKAPMKDWRAAFRTFEANAPRFGDADLALPVTRRQDRELEEEAAQILRNEKEMEEIRNGKR